MQVQVDYKSAAASIVDQEVTQVMEDVIGGAEGIKNIDSKSENGRSTINIEFDTSIDLDSAANDIRERVARVVDNLPDESDPPQILKRAAGFSTTMWLAVARLEIALLTLAQEVGSVLSPVAGSAVTVRSL